jgi:hypothetical protein
MGDKHSNQCAALLALLMASCSGGIDAREARQRADEYVRTQFNVTDIRLLKVETTEKPTDWVVTYSAKGEMVGGPLVIGSTKGRGAPV